MIRGFPAGFSAARPCYEKSPRHVSKGHHGDDGRFVPMKFPHRHPPWTLHNVSPYKTMPILVGSCPGSLPRTWAAGLKPLRRLSLFGPRLPGRLDDLADFVSKVELERDLIALGELFLRQNIGILHWARPGLTLHRPECEGALGLIDAYGCAAYRGGLHFTGEGGLRPTAAKGDWWPLSWVGNYPCSHLGLATTRL